MVTITIAFPFAFDSNSLFASGKIPYSITVSPAVRGTMLTGFSVSYCELQSSTLLKLSDNVTLSNK
jgi:hypothetical protein